MPAASLAPVCQSPALRADPHLALSPAGEAYGVGLSPRCACRAPVRHSGREAEAAGSPPISACTHASPAAAPVVVYVLPVSWGDSYRLFPSSRCIRQQLMFQP